MNSYSENNNSEYVLKQNILIALVAKGQASKRYKIGQTWELNFEELREVVNSLPVEDVGRIRHGKWIIRKWGDKGQCSECGFSCGNYDLNNFDNYCSHCGTKMEGVKNAESE